MVVNTFMPQFVKKGGNHIDINFVAEVAKQKKLKGLTNAGIGRMTGYTPYTIRAYLSAGRGSHRIKQAIAKVLDIKLQEESEEMEEGE